GNLRMNRYFTYVVCVLCALALVACSGGAKTSTDSAAALNSGSAGSTTAAAGDLDFDMNQTEDEAIATADDFIMPKLGDPALGPVRTGSPAPTNHGIITTLDGITFGPRPSLARGVSWAGDDSNVCIKHHRRNCSDCTNNCVPAGICNFTERP